MKNIALFKPRHLIIFLLIISGCSSWQLKKKCENTNWFEYSRDLSNSGKYLEEDTFIKQCKEVDKISASQIDLGFKSGRGRYCTYESFLRNGESGEPVNFQMCDNLIMYQMQQRYGQGLLKFCTPGVGYTYGASGKVYKNVCLKKDEDKFLPPYFKGRKEYLEKTITRISEEQETLVNLQTKLSFQINLVSNEISGLPSPQECNRQTVFNNATQQNETRVICEEATYIKMRRQTLYRQIDPLREQYSEYGTTIKKNAQALEDARLELSKIPTQINTNAIYP